MRQNSNMQDTRRSSRRIKKKQGFSLSRSAAYLRLLPHDARNSEGKRHVKSVPVRLCKPENQHKSHPDGRFCTAMIRYVFFFINQTNDRICPNMMCYIQKNSLYLFRTLLLLSRFIIWVLDCSFSRMLG